MGPIPPRDGAAVPSLSPVAYHGIVGEITRLIEPHTEADPAAVLLQLLVACGHALGRGPHFRVGAGYHYANEFLLLVGDTARGRKGTSEAEVRRVLRLGGDEAEKCFRSGLASGEGLIHEVRDDSREVCVNKKTGLSEEVTVDSGVTDKRLHVTEAEFGRTLAVMAREGNTLSAVIRDSWDGARELRTMTRKDGLVATEPHVSLVGHITGAELLAKLAHVEAVNGFANRFLFASVRRVRLLASGGALHDEDVRPLALELASALERGRRVGELRRDADAAKAWDERLYRMLTRDRPGMIGALTARAEVHVLRLALIFAVLDGAPAIGLQHLKPALAIWQFVEASVVYIFGERLGDPITDTLDDALRAAGVAGLTRKEMTDEVFRRNVPGHRISEALSTLANLARARGERQRRSGPGRPGERWFAITTPNEQNEQNELIQPGPFIPSFNSFTSYPSGDERGTP